MYLQCKIEFAWAVLPAAPVAWLKVFLNLGGAGWQTDARWSVAFIVTPAEHMHCRQEHGGQQLEIFCSKDTW